MALSEDILKAFEASGEEFTFEDLLSHIDERSYGILLVILSIPSALPLPAPGYSVPFGIALSILAAQLLIGRETPWFPEKVRKKQLKGSASGKFLKGAAKFIGFWEKFLRPRWTGFFRMKAFQKLIAFMILLCSVSMILPIPLTNTGPALGIFLLGLAMLEEDTLFAFFGLIVGLAGLLLTSTILFVIFSIIRAGFNGSWQDLMQQAEDRAKALFGR